jgi:glycosyltransferase involved in cell wall biosynthesis
MANKILFVTELRPFPLHGGQYIHSYNIIESLCQNFSVIVLAPAVSSNCKLLQKVKAWHQLPVEIHTTWHKINGIIHGYFKPRSEWYPILEKIYQRHKPHITWFDFGHWGQYTFLARKYGSQTIMGTHNAQADLSRQRYQAMPLGAKYVVQWLNYLTQRIHEKQFFPKFDRITSVSEQDRRYHARFVGNNSSLLLPNYINEDRYSLEKPIKREENLIVITGQFFNFQIKQGLIWFFKEVWPQVSQQIPQVRLQIIGRGSDKISSLVNQYPNVMCIGEIQTVVPYLRKATIAVVPLLHGSGTRIKILEALACETPVVSTTIGAQGLDLIPEKSILLADTGLKFAQMILHLLDDREKRSNMAQIGLNILRKRYGFDSNTKYIRQLITNLIDN